MKDCTGRELELGDRVAVSEAGQARMSMGTLISFTPKGAKIKMDKKVHFWKEDGHIVLRFDYQLCLVEHDPAMKAELESATKSI